MGNIATDYRQARLLLRLGKYEAWLVERIVRLLIQHDERVAADCARRQPTLEKANRMVCRRSLF